MKPETRRVRKLFKAYSELKIDEQAIKAGKNDEKVRADSFLITKEVLKEIKYVEVDGAHKTVLAKETIERFSPDNINPNYFWKQAAINFPMHAISANPDATDIEKVNTISLEQIHVKGPGTPLPTIISFLEKRSKSKKELEKDLVALNVQLQAAVFEEDYEKAANLRDEISNLNGIIKKTTNNVQPLTFLEIGPGFGCVKHALDYHFRDKIDYHAIDVHPLFEYDKLYKCNGSKFPRQLRGKRFDAIYSVNVFQHLSVKQRRSYYKEVYRTLKEGGAFIFSVMAMSEKSKDWVFDMPDGSKRRLFGFADEDDNFYIQFFSQFTRVQYGTEIQNDLTEAGLTIVSGEFKRNCLTIYCKKFTPTGLKLH